MQTKPAETQEGGGKAGADPASHKDAIVAGPPCRPGGKGKHVYCVGFAGRRDNYRKTAGRTFGGKPTFVQMNKGTTAA